MGKLTAVGVITLLYLFSGVDFAQPVGAMRFTQCAIIGARCGRLVRALDPSGRIAGTIDVYFEYYAARGINPKRQALVATEGGPGYPATESRDEYLSLFEPFRADHDVVIMDNRGTGKSAAINCHTLQVAPSLSIKDIGECGEQLGTDAQFFSTSYAVDDLEAVLVALGEGAVDLYGDSYGTFFAQVFAVRHPLRLRSLVLDGAYPLNGPELAWYRGYAPAMRDKFNKACERSLVCKNIPGTSIKHMQLALDRLRANAGLGEGRDVDGMTRHFSVNASTLAIVLFGSAPPFATLRDGDAAARAYASGDEVPLLRLMAEASASVDSRDATQDPKQFSEGLAAAVSCQDMPQIFDMGLAPAQRLSARNQVFEQRRRTSADDFAPFTLDEYRGLPLDYGYIEQCVAWPSVGAQLPAFREGETHGFPRIPVLVLSGEFDNITTVADGAAATAQFFKGQQVVLRNSFHVNALPHARTQCGAKIARQFIRALQPGDTTCAQEIASVRLAPSFAMQYTAVVPAIAMAGNQVSQPGLQVAAASLASCGDLLARLVANTSGQGVGLRGGHFSLRRDSHGLHASLGRIRWANDLEVTGSLDVDLQGDGGAARLKVRTDDGLSAKIFASWPRGGSDVRARLTGSVAGRVLVAEAAAP